MSGDGAGSEVTYRAPRTVEAALDRIEAADGRAQVVAGGQTLVLLLRQGFVDAGELVDVTGIPAMSGISVTDGTVTVGATTTYADLAAHRASDRVRAFADACSVVADPQVRNLGTVGGAVCHADPAFDVLAPLLAHDAELRLVGPDGARSLPLAEFFVGHMRTARRDGELLESIRFALPGPDHGTAYEKHSPVDGGWTTVGVAAVVGLDDGAFEDVRVALAAVADSTVRARSVEERLVGEPATDEAVADASEAVVEDVDPMDDRAGSAEYKRHLAATLVERSVRTAVDRAEGER